KHVQLLEEQIADLVLKQRYSKALKGFDQLHQNGLIANETMYMCAIQCCNALGFPERALSLLRDAVASNLATSDVIFNQTIAAISRDLSLEESDNVFSQMQQLGIAPTSLTFVELLKGSAKGVHPSAQDAERYMDLAVQHGIEIDARMYSYIIEAYCMTG